MSEISRSIGNRFEDFLQGKLPELVSTGDDPLVPDFFHPELNFWVEAKAGYFRWGQKIKEKQINGFNQKGPIIYGLGTHNLHSSNSRLTQKTERGRQAYLKKYMKILHVCFVNNELMRKIWDKEHKLNEKGTILDCELKGGILRNIFGDKSFSRFEKRIASAEEFYGFDYDDFLMIEPPRSDDTSYGAILHKEYDAVVIEYLRGKEFLK